MGLHTRLVEPYRGGHTLILHVLGGFQETIPGVTPRFRHRESREPLAIFPSFSCEYHDPSGYWWPPSFSSLHFSVMMKFIYNCGFCTSRAVLNPYTISKWILVAAHLF
jgi:hypothetical protein